MVGFTAIRRASNDRAYSTRQHFAVLTLLRATPIIRDFVTRIVSGCSTNFMLTLQAVRSNDYLKTCALERLFEDVRIPRIAQ